MPRRNELEKEGTLTTVGATKGRSLRHRRSRRNDDVEAQRLVTGCDDRDVVRTRGQLEMMVIAAEFLDDTGIRSVDKHLSAPRIDVELQPAYWGPFKW